MFTVHESDNSPEAGAVRFWQLATSPDATERGLLGGLLHPRARLRAEAVLADIETLSGAEMAARLEPSTDDSVRYAMVIENAETVDGQLTKTHLATRYVTLKWEETLKFWSVYHYGRERISPSVIPG